MTHAEVISGLQAEKQKLTSFAGSAQVQLVRELLDEACRLLRLDLITLRQIVEIHAESHNPIRARRQMADAAIAALDSAGE